MEVKKQHGGKRNGSGRKCNDYDTVLMRIPSDVLEQVKAIVLTSKNNAKIKPIQADNKPLQNKTFSCGCILSSGLFRRATGCKIERTKHV